MMDAQRLLTASVLDIVFDGRNKAYGAYVLRNEYNKRLYTALAATGLFILLLLTLYYFSKGPDNAHAIEPPALTPTVVEIIEPPKKEVPPVAPPKPVVQSRIRTIRVTVPVIVKDPPKEDMPPKNDKIETAKIGNITQDGDAATDLVPPHGSSNGVTGALERPSPEEDIIFTRVEIESMYPGGPDSWKRFLLKTVRYPSDAQEKGIQGTVIVQFIVDKTGAVSNAEAISGPEELRSEALSVIKKSGNWTPAIQNGAKVKSYKKQPITFQLADD